MNVIEDLFKGKELQDIESFSMSEKQTLLMWFALGINKPRIGKLGKVVAIETSKALSSEIKATTISISTTECELAGCTLANDGSSTDINGFTFDELKKNADARGFGILKGTVSNHDCPLQTECYECEGSGVCKDCQGSKRVDCVNCEGTGECPTCGGTQTVPCTVCGGDGKCTNCGGDGECPSCGGSGKEDCTVCDGDGELWCDACGGSGYYRDGVECRKCDGTGHVTCYRCHGRGTFYCSECNGSGTCPECDGDGDCQQCEGRGDFYCKDCYHHNGKCIRCKGKGKVKCEHCEGSGVCPVCGGNGIICCPRCNGTGYYQTFTSYQIKEFTETYAYRPTTIYGKQVEEFESTVIYAKTFEEYSGIGQKVIDDQDMLNVLGENRKDFIQWYSDNINAKENSELHPLSKYATHKCTNVIKINYTLNGKNYDFYIVGDKKLTIYEKVPGALNIVHENAKSMFRKIRGIFGSNE